MIKKIIQESNLKKIILIKSWLYKWKDINTNIIIKPKPLFKCIKIWLEYVYHGLLSYMPKHPSNLTMNSGHLNILWMFNQSILQLSGPSQVGVVHFSFFFSTFNLPLFLPQVTALRWTCGRLAWSHTSCYVGFLPSDLQTETRLSCLNSSRQESMSSCLLTGIIHQKVSLH